MEGYAVNQDLAPSTELRASGRPPRRKVPPQAPKGNITTKTRFRRRLRSAVGRKRAVRNTGTTRLEILEFELK